MEKPILRVMNYDSNSLEEKDIHSVYDIQEDLKREEVTWLNIYGVHDVELIAELGDVFSLPPLLLEDILNTDSRPKYEDHEHFDAFILKMLRYDHALGKIVAEQISILLGENYVITLQERVGDVFDPVRTRIRNYKGRVRLNDNDYLAYALMDTIVDNYIVAIELVGQKADELENKIFRSHSPGLAEEIYKLKTDLSYLRKTVRPTREIITNLAKSESTFFQEKNRVFLRDLEDLVVQSSEAIELYNQLVSDQLNIYNTNMGNALNEVMKVLTIFASIFIPLTFLAGIYGMNFEYIPELSYRYAYPLFWLVVLISAGGLAYYFKRKNWW